MHRQQQPEGVGQRVALGLRDERSEDLPLGIGEVGAVAAARRGTAKRRSLLPSLPPSRL